jgi:hypothetical protein
MKWTFELLRWRLLLLRLESLQGSELHALAIREAQVSAILACETAFPGLLFPCLFEERVEAALARQAREVSRYWRELRPPATAAALSTHNPGRCYVLAASPPARAELDL